MPLQEADVTAPRDFLYLNGGELLVGRINAERFTMSPEETGCACCGVLTLPGGDRTDVDDQRRSGVDCDRRRPENRDSLRVCRGSRSTGQER
jgi:hypothetical protein